MEQALNLEDCVLDTTTKTVFWILQPRDTTTKGYYNQGILQPRGQQPETLRGHSAHPLARPQLLRDRIGTPLAQPLRPVPPLLMPTAATYALRVRLYQMYGRLRCDNVLSSVFVQDSISAPASACHPQNKGCNNVVKMQVGLPDGLGDRPSSSGSSRGCPPVYVQCTACVHALCEALRDPFGRPTRVCRSGTIRWCPPPST